MKKRIQKLINILWVLASVIIGFLLSEAILWLFFPQEYIFPGYLHSSKYGIELPAGREQLHRKGRLWNYHYQINSKGFRGSMFRNSNSDSTKIAIALGDSYTFGQCVNEGEFFTELLNKEMKNDSFFFINMATPGWSLGQEVRCFYEKGVSCHPEFVLLQFCANDPEELLINPVAFLNNNQIVLETLPVKQNSFTDFLGEGCIKKSQCYNLLRSGILKIRYHKNVNKKTTTASASQEKYIELISAFARDLKKKNIQLLFFAVNKQLDGFPEIKNGISQLEKVGDLEYIETENWFKIDETFLADDGHLWNNKAHRIIADRLKERFSGGK